MNVGLLRLLYSPGRGSVNAALVVAALAAITAFSPEAQKIWTCDEALRRLFTPLHPQLGSYDVCVTTATLPSVIQPEWVVEATSPADAFGSAGIYNRSALARLYGGRRVAVARGWRRTDHGFESLTFISPYPDASLTHLQPGTLRIRLML